MATTLSRPSFAGQRSGWMNVKFDNATGIAVGNTLTFTKAALYGSGTVTGTVVRLLPNGAAVVNVTGLSRPSGELILPKGTNVA